MWRSARLPRRQQLAGEPSPVPDTTHGNASSAAATAEPAKPSGLSRGAPDAQQMLEELRGQPGFGVVMTSSEVQPANATATLGQKLNAELDQAISRERQILELIDLANRPARELTPEQFRRLSEILS